MHLLFVFPSIILPSRLSFIPKQITTRQRLKFPNPQLHSSKVNPVFHIYVPLASSSTLHPSSSQSILRLTLPSSTIQHPSTPKAPCPLLSSRSLHDFQAAAPT